MKVSKRTQVYVRGIGFVKAEELVKLIQGGNVVELRGMFGNWIKVNEGYLSVKSDSIKLELRNGSHVVASSDTNILHILPNSYSIASKRIDELKKSNILVYGNQLMDEENGIRLTDSELEDIIGVLNYCITYVDHGYDVFMFTTNTKEHVEKLFKRFVPQDKQDKIVITYKNLGKSKGELYRFRLPYKDADAVFKVIEKYKIDIENRSIPDCLFIADRDTRIRFYKLLNPISYFEITSSGGSTRTAGVFAKKNHSTMLNYTNFMHSIGISGIVRINNTYLDDNTIPKSVYQINADDCMYSMDVDSGYKYTGARNLVYMNPSWNSSRNDYPASCRSIFNACCDDNGSENYKFLKKFYEHQQPIKIKAISETEDDMVELISNDYVDIGGVFLK